MQCYSCLYGLPGKCHCWLGNLRGCLIHSGLEFGDSDRSGSVCNVFINSDGKFFIVESSKVCICHRIKRGQFNSDICMCIWTLLRGMSFRVGGCSVCVAFKILSNSTCINAEENGLGEGEL